MNYKDSLGDEIKKIYEEETDDIGLSPHSIDKIMMSRKVSLREKTSIFLNKEIEIPLAPAIVGFVLILGISIFPKELPKKGKIEIIDFNGSQIIMTSKKEVGIK